MEVALLVIWFKSWHWFGYSLVSVQEFGPSKRLFFFFFLTFFYLPAMPLVVRRRSASLRALQCFGFGTTREEENQGECRERERADGPSLVNTWPGVCAPQRRPLSAPAGD